MALIHRELGIMYEICMKYQCKICPRQTECEKEYSEQHLMYKPFEKLLEILTEKGIVIWK